jgi:type I restriction enzyme M protein
MTKTFSSVKQEFDSKYENLTEFDSFLPEHLTYNKRTNIKNKTGKKNEEYYKWQFLYAIVNSGFYAKDYIGTEVYLPKGNKNAAPLKLDAAVFDSADWFEKYQKYNNENDVYSLD